MKKSLVKYAWLFLLPTLAAYLIAFLVPFLLGIGLSFSKFNTVADASFVGLDNFRRIFTDSQSFIDAFWFTGKFTIFAVILVNLVGFALALALTQKIKGTNSFRTIFFMPNLIGGIVLGYIWQILINGVLLPYGYDITVKAQFGFIGLLLVMLWQMGGYMMVIYIASLQNIPVELIEAAKIDGATRWQTLRSVTLPMVMPAITICTFLTLTNSFKLFDQNLALTKGLPGKQTAMLALDIYDTYYGRNGFKGVGQAKALIFFLMVLVLALIQLRITRSREVSGE